MSTGTATDGSFSLFTQFRLCFQKLAFDKNALQLEQNFKSPSFLLRSD
jgi:hypothetical protein